MNESEFIQEALHLKEKTYGLQVSLDRMRKALEFLSSKLQKKMTMKHGVSTSNIGSNTGTISMFTKIFLKLKFTSW